MRLCVTRKWARWHPVYGNTVYNTARKSLVTRTSPFSVRAFNSEDVRRLLSRARTRDSRIW